MATTPILDNSEYEIVIPYIHSDADENFDRYGGFNFGLGIIAKSLRIQNTKYVDSKDGVYVVDFKSVTQMKLLKQSDYYKSLQAISSITLICGIVTSPCDGTVMYISESTKYKHRYSMTILIDQTQCIVFDNLCFIFYGFDEGSKVFVGDKLGLYYVPKGNATDIHPYLIFSYASLTKSLAPVRVWDMTFYKEDPTSKLDDIIEANVVKMEEDIPSDQGFEFGVADGWHSTPEVQN